MREPPHFGWARCLFLTLWSTFAGSALEDDDAWRLNRNVFFFGFIFQLSCLKERFWRSVKLFFFPSFFFVLFFLCSHGDVSSFSCSVSKEEATFLSCVRHFLCAGKAEVCFLLVISAVSVWVLKLFAKAAQVKRDWLQKVHQIRAVSERFHLLPLEAEIKTWACARRRNVTDTQLNRASVTHAVMSHWRETTPITPPPSPPLLLLLPSSSTACVCVCVSQALALLPAHCYSLSDCDNTANGCTTVKALPPFPWVQYSLQYMIKKKGLFLFFVIVCRGIFSHHFPETGKKKRELGE